MKSINLDITHRCTLECSRCERIRWTARGEKVPGEDMELYAYLKILNYFDHINFCGNRADPVFNPNFIQFLAINKKRNKSCEIHNAATGKNLAWYQRAFKANTDAVWHFGIDGLPEKILALMDYLKRVIYIERIKRASSYMKQCYCVRRWV